MRSRHSRSINFPTASDIVNLRQEITKAGRLCMQIRDSGILGETTKGDSSPVTQADLAANQILESCLASLEFQAPIVSEESSNRITDLGLSYRLVDALDGTKDFITGSDGFTQNVCLVSHGEPVFGAVYAPAFDFMAWTGRQGRETPAALGVGENGDNSNSEGETIVASKSHLDERTKAFLAKFPDSETVQIGSSLKVLLLAIGEAEIYPRFAPTMPWDVAAADACLRSAGGGLFGRNGELLEYSRPLETNPEFLGISSSMMSRRRELISAMNDVCA